MATVQVSPQTFTNLLKKKKKVNLPVYSAVIMTTVVVITPLTASARGGFGATVLAS